MTLELVENGPQSFPSPSCGKSAGPDIGLSWDPGFPGRYSIRTNSTEADTLLSVYVQEPRGCLGQELDCNDDIGSDTNAGLLEFVALPGVAYVIVVEGLTGAMADIGVVNLTITALDAEPITTQSTTASTTATTTMSSTPSTTQSTTISTTGSTSQSTTPTTSGTTSLVPCAEVVGPVSNGNVILDNFSPLCANASSRADDAKLWIAPFPGMFSVSTQGSDFDTVLEVFLVPDVFTCSDLSQSQGCNDDFDMASSHSVVTFTADKGDVFLVVVESAQEIMDMNATSYTLTFTALTPRPTTTISTTASTSATTTGQPCAQLNFAPPSIQGDVALGRTNLDRSSCLPKNIGPMAGVGWTAPFRGTFQVNVTGPSDLALTVLADASANGASCGVEEACNDDAAGTTDPSVVIEVEEDEFFILLVEQAIPSGMTLFNLTITALTDPPTTPTTSVSTSQSTTVSTSQSTTASSTQSSSQSTTVSTSPSTSQSTTLSTTQSTSPSTSPTTSVLTECDDFQFELEAPTQTSDRVCAECSVGPCPTGQFESVACSESADRVCTDIPPVVVDCEVSEWSFFSGCSASCDSGTQSRRRSIVVAPLGGGATCPPLEETRACNEEPCPVVCDLPTEGGDDCRTFINACSESPCMNGGTCTNSFTCTCDPGIIGETCDTDEVDCEPNPCSNNGTCIEVGRLVGSVALF